MNVETQVSVTDVRGVYIGKVCSWRVSVWDLHRKPYIVYHKVRCQWQYTNYLWVNWCIFLALLPNSGRNTLANSKVMRALIVRYFVPIHELLFSVISHIITHKMVSVVTSIPMVFRNSGSRWYIYICLYIHIYIYLYIYIYIYPLNIGLFNGLFQQRYEPKSKKDKYNAVAQVLIYCTSFIVVESVYCIHYRSSVGA